MKYTLRSFMQAFVGDLLALEENMECEPYFKWDGNNIYIYNDEYWPIKSHSYLDSISFHKMKPGRFILPLLAENNWDFEIEFSDGGPVKNKEYMISEILNEKTK